MKLRGDIITTQTTTSRPHLVQWKMPTNKDAKIKTVIVEDTDTDVSEDEISFEISDIAKLGNPKPQGYDSCNDARMSLGVDAILSWVGGILAWYLGGTFEKSHGHSEEVSNGRELLFIKFAIERKKCNCCCE